MRFAVEQWAPDYGSAVGVPDEATAELNIEMEVAAGDWKPVTPLLDPPEEVVFVDGVARIDAQVWISDNGGEPVPGVCASFAAGRVRCSNARAAVEDVRVGRSLFSSAASAEAIATRHASYAVSYAAGELEALAAEATNKMRRLEAEVAEAADDAALIVLDGLLWGRESIPNAIGYVKTHRTLYLPDEANEVVAALTPGQRTPVFLVKTTWNRLSWYMRLPGGTGHPWAGIVRCEASPDIAVQAAARLADLACAALPRFASSSHRDPRAPQNLTPIAGLEDALRHRLGDAELLLRALRAAAV